VLDVDCYNAQEKKLTTDNLLHNSFSCQ